MTLQTYQTILDLIDAKTNFAVAQLLQTNGSTPLKTGARAVVEANGDLIHGTIGGGQVEAAAQQRAAEACRAGRVSVFDFPLSGADAGETLPICGGIMRVLIDPRSAHHREVFAQAAEAVMQRRRGVLLTRIKTKPETEVHIEWLPEHSATKTPAMQTALAKETPQFLQEADTELLIEPLIPLPRLVIVGGGHVGRALVHQASLVDFDVTVVDDRPEFVDPTHFPDGVHIRCGDIAQQVADLATTTDTYMVIVTRGHRFDAEALRACIHKPVAYIGMIGSKRKTALMRTHFVSSGIATEEQFDRVYAPIGLGIGALTAAEIAASIVAQLIAVRRTGQTP